MNMTNRAWAEMALLGLIWGGSFVTVAMALKEMGPFAAVLWRTGLGALTLWLAAAALRAPLPRDPAFWGACAVMGVLNNVIPFTLMAWGQQSIEMPASPPSSTPPPPSSPRWPPPPSSRTNASPPAGRAASCWASPASPRSPGPRR